MKTIWSSVLFFISLQIFGQNSDRESLIREHFNDGIQRGRIAISPNVQMLDILDSARSYHFDTTAQQWDNNQVHRYGYDVVYNQTSDLMLQWNTTWNAYLYQQKVDIVYNAAGEAVSSTIRNWNGAAWVNSRQYLNVYNTNGDLTEETELIWNGAAWENSSRQTLAYNANNGLVIWYFEYWISNSWTNYLFYRYSYDANNNQDSALRLTWDGWDWLNDNLNVNTYDVNQNLATQSNYLWSNNNWQLMSRSDFSFNVNNLMTNHQLALWANNAWDTAWQDIYSYDANNNMVEDEWDIYSSGVWSPSSRYLMTYNPTNTRATFVIERMDNSQWVGQDSTHYYYSVVSGIHEADLSGDVHIFPNPSSGIFYLDNMHENDEIMIYDGTGRMVLQRKAGMENAIDLSSFGDGVYFMELRTEQGIMKRKLVKQ